MMNRRIFKVITLMAILLMLFSSFGFAFDRFTGGGWLPNGLILDPGYIDPKPIAIIEDVDFEPTGKASFGFTAKVIEEVEYLFDIHYMTQGEFQYNDKVVGLKFHCDVYKFELIEEDTVILYGSYIEDDVKYYVQFTGIFDPDGLRAKIKVTGSNGFHYYNENTLGGGTFKLK